MIHNKAQSISRTLAVHPDTRRRARIAAAFENTLLRYATGDALARLAASGASVTPAPAPDGARINISAVTDRGTWTRLDHLRELHALTWDQVLRAALTVDPDTACIAGGDRR